MKDWRFYEEFEHKRKGVSAGNVVAVYLPTWTESLMLTKCVEALSALFFRPNSPVSFGGVSLGHLQEKCKRVSETRAREVHPALFERLDSEEVD